MEGGFLMENGLTIYDADRMIRSALITRLSDLTYSRDADLPRWACYTVSDDNGRLGQINLEMLDGRVVCLETCLAAHGDLLRAARWEMFLMAYKTWPQVQVVIFGTEGGQDAHDQEQLQETENTTQKRKPHPDILKRREDVKRLWQQGYPDFEIAKALNYSESTIYRDRVKMKLPSYKTNP